MRLRVDPDVCISSGECTYNHPDLFHFGDGVAAEVLIADITSPRHLEEARQAIEVCPSGAISLTE